MAKYTVKAGGITYDYSEQVANNVFPSVEQVLENIRKIEAGETVPGFVKLTADTSALQDALSEKETEQAASASASSSILTFGLFGAAAAFLIKKFV